MLFTDIIRTKRDGGELSDEQIRFFVDGLADESLPAEQVSALAMAIFLNSMNFEEAGKLTLAMAASGTVLDWSKEWVGRSKPRIVPVVERPSRCDCPGRRPRRHRPWMKTRTRWLVGWSLRPSHQEERSLEDPGHRRRRRPA